MVGDGVLAGHADQVVSRLKEASFIANEYTIGAGEMVHDKNPPFIPHRFNIPKRTIEQVLKAIRTAFLQSFR